MFLKAFSDLSFKEVYFTKVDGVYAEHVTFLQINIYKFYKTFQHSGFKCYASDEDKHIMSSIPCG